MILSSNLPQIKMEEWKLDTARKEDHRNKCKDKPKPFYEAYDKKKISKMSPKSNLNTSAPTAWRPSQESSIWKSISNLYIKKLKISLASNAASASQKKAIFRYTWEFTIMRNLSHAVTAQQPSLARETWVIISEGTSK